MPWHPPARRETHLVTHLGGETLETSLGLVDKALYGERYLQNFAGRPTHPYYGRVWLDDNGGSGAGHRPSLLDPKDSTAPLYTWPPSAA